MKNNLTTLTKKKTVNFAENSIAKNSTFVFLVIAAKITALVFKLLRKKELKQIWYEGQTEWQQK